MGVERARRRERRGGRGDDGKDTCDAGGDGGVNGRGDRLRSANANKCQQMCARCACLYEPICARVYGWAGAPWRMTSLLPLRKVLRAHR